MTMAETWSSGPLKPVATWHMHIHLQSSMSDPFKHEWICHAMLLQVDVSMQLQHSLIQSIFMVRVAAHGSSQSM
jgi:hypothetical protein